jgi:hypothetical protein
MARIKGMTGLMSKPENRQLVLEVLRETGDLTRASAAVGYKNVQSLNSYLDDSPIYKKECALAIRYFQTRDELIKSIVAGTELAHERILDKTIKDSLLKELIFYTPNKYSIPLSIPRNLNALHLFEEALMQVLYAHTQRYITLSLPDLIKVGEALIKISPTGFVLMQLFSQFMQLFKQEQDTMEESTKEAVKGLLDKFKAAKLDEMLSRAHTLKDGIEASEVLSSEEKDSMCT